MAGRSMRRSAPSARTAASTTCAPSPRPTRLCNAYALDTIAAGMIVSFAMECFEDGAAHQEGHGRPGPALRQRQRRWSR